MQAEALACFDTLKFIEQPQDAEDSFKAHRKEIMDLAAKAGHKLTTFAEAFRALYGDEAFLTTTQYQESRASSRVSSCATSRATSGANTPTGGRMSNQGRSKKPNTLTASGLDLHVLT